MFKTTINKVINNEYVQAGVEGFGKGLEIGGKLVMGTAVVTAPILVPGGQAAVTAKTLAQGAACVAAGKATQKGVKKIQDKNKKETKPATNYHPEPIEDVIIDIYTDKVINLLAKGQRAKAIEIVENELYEGMWSDRIRHRRAVDFVEQISLEKMNEIDDKFNDYASEVIYNTLYNAR
jgi:hypothetical protein